MIRITWALVVLGGALLIGGFFMSDQNILLILAIAVELAAIILVLASWARRAKDAADAYDEDLSFGTVGDDTAGDEDEELLETFADEEFVVGGRSARKPARKSARKSGSKPAARSKPKPAARKAKPAARKTKAAKKAPTRKSAAKPRTTAKPAAKKPAARKPTKSKPQRRKPSTG